MPFHPVCTNVDTHFGHASPTPNPFHITPYVATQSLVTAMGTPIITVGDLTACGDPVVGFSSLVTVGGKGVHRQFDTTGGHGSWVPNAAATGRPLVKAGG